jgi:hypothetical protein
MGRQVSPKSAANARRGLLTIDQDVKNCLTVLFDQVVYVTENATAHCEQDFGDGRENGLGTTLLLSDVSPQAVKKRQ